MLRYAFEKIGMTHMFSADGNSQGVTLLKLTPGKVIRHETIAGGRTLAVVEYDTGKKKKMTRGWIIAKPDDLPVGSEVAAPDYKVGQKLAISGISKGQGFQDAMTRHNFRGGPQSHGSRFHRAPGSVGMRAEPGRTPKGKKLPGHTGSERVTVRNLAVAYWSADEKVLAVVGGVPGARKSAIFI